MNPNTQNNADPMGQTQPTVGAQTPVQTPTQQNVASNFKADPMQTTLNTGTKVLSIAAMVTSLIALFKKFIPKK